MAWPGAAVSVTIGFWLLNVVMEPLFDIYLTGQCTADAVHGDVVEGLARLFKLDPSAADGLLDGQSRRVKRDCDKATALRYRAALHELGAEVRLTRLDPSEQTVAPAEVDNHSGDTPAGLNLAPVGTRLSDQAPPPSQVIAIPEYTIAPAGDLIPSLSEPQTPITPSIDHLELCDLDPN